MQRSICRAGLSSAVQRWSVEPSLEMEGGDLSVEMEDGALSRDECGALSRDEGWSPL
jgi:hypothetical protein